MTMNEEIVEKKVSKNIRNVAGSVLSNTSTSRENLYKHRGAVVSDWQISDIRFFCPYPAYKVDVVWQLTDIICWFQSKWNNVSWSQLFNNNKICPQAKRPTKSYEKMNMKCLWNTMGTTFPSWSHGITWPMWRSQQGQCQCHLKELDQRNTLFDWDHHILHR